MKYILSIGTNIGNREANIAEALSALALVPKTELLRKSRLYLTAPQGFTDQDDFYNISVEVESKLNPHEMLGVCLGIEAGLGRIRAFRNGPRIIDIDIIFAENLSINSENLILPHPRYHERQFVLVPMLDLYPSGVVYGTDIMPYVKATHNQKVNLISNSNS